jgi:hypothetical protein
MLTCDDLVEISRICFKQAREAKKPPISDEFRHLAQGYRVRAAAANSGQLPALGEDDG